MKKFEKYTTKEYWNQKKINIKNFYHKLFFEDRKKLFICYGISLATMFVIFLISFLLRQYYINTTFDLSNNSSNVVSNTGISFGLLNNNSGVVYFLQMIPIFFTGIAIIHNRRYFVAVAVALIFSAGLSNFVDRLIPDYFGRIVAGSFSFNDPIYVAVAYNGVVDYWQNSTSIFNFPDVIIMVGIGLVFVYSFVNAWIETNAKKREEEAAASEIENNTALLKI